jgi:ureidoglycolate dehydrogenase (NAD+)
MAGYYALRMLSQGYIAMVMTDTDRMLVPFGARKSFFGTSPICFGFPSDGVLVILDMASTSIAWGKIALAKVEGQSIPASWALDADGKPTTDPAAVVGLHPIAGPKGSALAMVIGIFCSLLAGMSWGPRINRMYAEMDQRHQLDHFVWALDVRNLMPVEVFKAQLAQMVKELTSLPTAEGFDRVYHPGEIEGLRRAQRRAKGIPVEPGLYSDWPPSARPMAWTFPAELMSELQSGRRARTMSADRIAHGRPSRISPERLPYIVLHRCWHGRQGWRRS